MSNSTAHGVTESFNCFGLFSLIGDKLQQQRDQYRLMLNGKANGGMDENLATTTVKVRGSVVLQKKNVLDFNDFTASVTDKAHELLGKKVKLQLVSVSETDQENGLRGRLTSPAFLQNWVKSEHRIDVGETVFDVNFELDQDFGVPGAFIIENHHNSEFYLKELVLHDLPEGKGKVHFICNSWVYPTKKYTYDRVFFANQSYLPSETPQPLRRLRETQLMHKKGDGKGQLQYWDRVYDYAFYNDLGEPDKGKNYARTTLGGSTDYPYPRRGRTGRPPNKSDKKTESRLPLISLDVYVPRDERFGHLKMSDFLAYSLKAIVQILAPELKSLFDKTPKEFDTFQDVLDLYENSSASPDNHAFKTIMKNIPNFEMLKELFRADGGKSMKYPMPQVIENDKSAWRSDEEFGRETLAGVNPVCICRLKEFPPVSKLDVEKYGNQNSTIKEEHVVDNLSGLTVQEALEQNKLFILDYHDTFMTYLNRINSNTTTKTYASRTLFFLKDDGTLTPIAIELSLPHPQGEVHGAVSEVYTPAREGVEGSVWQLAKAYAAINDSGYHQLISHWLNTHAVIEPFVIATNRQLSELHPMYKLLQPHFRDTMNINALARQILINAGGVLETTVFPARYAMEMSAVVYKSWNFNKQALPDDLIERGMAVKDPHKPHGLRLMIEDYPYAVDGLEIWAAIEIWVHDYCNIYYDSDHAVKYDSELQAWWQEIRYVGHGDKKDEPWWSKMDTKHELIKMVTIIIWVASALHAAVNFGQYPYAGYLPNRPTMSRQFMPKPGTSDYAELEKNPDGVFLKTITAQLQTLLGISIIEVLSMHSSDEIYLGQNPNPGVWTANEEALAAFERFRERLMVTESRITQMNNETGEYKNRFGPVKVPYTLLFPNTSVVGSRGGLTGKGIPNSVSI